MEACSHFLLRAVPSSSTLVFASSAPSQAVFVSCSNCGTSSSQVRLPQAASSFSWTGASERRSQVVLVSTRRDSLAITVAASIQEACPPVSPREDGDARVKQIHSVEEFEEALEKARRRLVVVEYAASHSANSKRIYPAMVSLSRSCQDVEFLLVMGDESEGTKELCRRAGVEKVPHFIFYKNAEKIHEEEGIDEEKLTGDVLYYGDHDAPVQHLQRVEELEALLEQASADDRLVVLDVGLKRCGPCVKVYPTFVKLARKMQDTVSFARMHGDENEETMRLMKNMEVLEVPTFLFIRQGKLRGRYVGSGKGELIGEILRYQGVRVTY